MGKNFFIMQINTTLLVETILMLKSKNYSEQVKIEKAITNLTSLLLTVKTDQLKNIEKRKLNKLSSNSSLIDAYLTPLGEKTKSRIDLILKEKELVST